MVKIWANRLIAGTKTFSEVPASRKDAVIAELKLHVKSGEITAQRYEEITGAPYDGNN